MKLKLLLLTTLFLNVLSAQTDPPPPGIDEAPLEIGAPAVTEREDKAFELFDIQKEPLFPGGLEAMYQYLQQNLKYPELAKENNIQGRVILQFIVEKDGSVSNVVILRDIGGGCGKESVRVVQAMPRWTPGIANNHPVRVRYTLPLTFKFESELLRPMEVEVNGEDSPPPIDEIVPAPAHEESIYSIIEKEPSFPGGEQEMLKFISRNLRYPDLAKENGISGRVIVSFVVGKDGELTGIQIVKDIGGSCGQEAVRVVSMMPKWIPGEHNGHPVKVQYTLPIKFYMD